MTTLLIIYNTIGLIVMIFAMMGVTNESGLATKNVAWCLIWCLACVTLWPIIVIGVAKEIISWKKRQQ